MHRPSTLPTGTPRFGTVLVWVVLALVAAPTPALAHDIDPSVRTVIDSITPDVDGLTVEVATTVTTQLVVENRTDHDLVIVGEGGEDFLRIGADGVRANVASPDWYRTNDPSGTATVPSHASPAADPDWRTVSAEPSWGWFDHRLHDRPLVATNEPDGTERLFDWEVPLRLGDEPGAIRGHVERRPILGAPTAEVTAVDDALDGVTIQLMDGRVPGLFLTSARDDGVVVLGADGEPFLRIAEGAVAANTRSPLWAANAASRGQPPPEHLDPADEPDWIDVAPGSGFGWLEPRAAYLADEPDDPAQAAELFAWEVPIVAGAEEMTVRGVTRWVPAEGVEASFGERAAGLPWRGIALVVVGAAAVAVLGPGRRTGRS